MVAMTAAGLGEGERALDILLMDTPKNTWRASGHNWQRAIFRCTFRATALCSRLPATWPG
jgi:hypothetical protein